MVLRSFFFVNDEESKVNSKTYKKHLEKELIPDIERIIKRRDWMFIQDITPLY